MQPDFVWLGNNTFGASYGSSGKQFKINGPNTGQSYPGEYGWALDVQGDVRIDGDLVVAYGELQNNDTELAANVELNTGNLTAGTQNLSNLANKTTIWGPTKIYGGVKLDLAHVSGGNPEWDPNYHYDAADNPGTSNDADGKPGLIVQNASANGQARFQYDDNNFFDLKVDTGGNLLLATEGNIQLLPNGENWLDPGQVLPKSTYTIDLGSDTRKFRSIYAGELVVDHLVAQHVMATIGGKIMVAPTSTFTQNWTDANLDQNGLVYLEHNDPNFRNAWLFAQKWDGTNAQIEAFKTADSDPIAVTSGDITHYKYTVVTRNGDGTGANNWAEGDTVVSLYKLGAGGNKGYIELTSTGSPFADNGPRITMFSAKTTDTAWNAALPMFSVGKIKGYADYSADDDFGLVLANDATLSPVLGMKGVTLDKDQGVRLWNTPIQIYDNSQRKVEILKDGSFRLGSALAYVGTEPTDGWTHDQWATSPSQGVGLSWDGDTLIVDGILSIQGSLLSDELSNLQTDIDSNTNAIGDIPSSFDSMTDYQAASALMNAFPGNLAPDWDFEFAPQDEAGDSNYDPMECWKAGHGLNPSRAKKANFANDGIVPRNGNYCLGLLSQFNPSNNNTVVYATNLAGVENCDADGNNCTPVVSNMYIPTNQGVKYTINFWGYIKGEGWSNGTPPNNLLQVGFKLFSHDRQAYTWIAGIAKSDQTTNTWKKHTGTWTVPTEYNLSYGTGTGVQDIAYIQPMILCNEHSGQPEMDVWAFVEEVEIFLDNTMAMPANPTGEASFLAGNDAFGMHDGNIWRTYFGLPNDSSVFKLSDSDNNDLIKFDGTELTINGGITTTGGNGDLNLSGSITIASAGNIHTYGSGFNQTGMFMGHVQSGSNYYPKFSLIEGSNNDSTELVYDSQYNFLKIKNADVSIENFGADEVDIYLGNNFGYFASGDTDNIMIGKWESMPASSPAGTGLLVQHNTIRSPNAGTGYGSGKFDYTKIHEGGFNRSGFDYPVFIGTNPLCAGWANADTLTTDGHKYWNRHANKVFDHPALPADSGLKKYIDVYGGVIPEGRAILIQVQPAGAGWQQLPSSAYGNPHLHAGQAEGSTQPHEHTVPDEWGTDYANKNSGMTQFSFQGFYRANDNFTVDNATLGIHAMGDLFNNYPDGAHGPWMNCIPPGTNVTDLKHFNIFTESPCDSTTLVQRIRYSSLMVWEVEAASINWDYNFYDQDAFDSPIYGFSFSVGQNPF